MSAKIADLKIGIKNQGESAVKDLQDLATALKTIDKAKKSLNFEDTVSKSNQGLRQLESTVQKLANIMKPLADQMEKISKGFGVLGARKNLASASASGKSGVASATEATNAISEKLAGLASTSIDSSRIGALSTTATEASSKLDILRQKLELLKQKYNELSASPSKALEATNTAYQIKNLEATIKKLEEGKKATTGFAVGLKNVGNELRQTSITSSLANTSIGRLVTSFGRLLKLKLLRMVVMEFYKSIGEGIKNLYEYSRALGSVDSANFKNTMDSYSTSMQTLKNSVGAMIGQVITAMLPTIQTLINYLTTAINVINQFFAALQGKAVFTKAKDSFTEWAEGTSSSAGGASDSIKELQRTILAFDELNVLNSPDTGSGGGGGGGGASTPDYTDMFEEADINEKIKKVADKVKEVIDFIRENFDTIWAIASNIGLALLAWKIASEVASFFSMLDKLGFTKNAGKIAFGITLSLVGFAIEATGAYDIGKNGANLRNIIQTALGGALGMIGGVIAFGASSLLVTIPLSILVFVAGFSFGETEKRRAEDEIYQYGIGLQQEIDEIVGRIEVSLSIANDTSALDGITEKVGEAYALADAIFDIAGKAELGRRDVENLKLLVEQFNGLGLGEIQAEFTDTTAVIHSTSDEIYGLIEAYKLQAQTEAYLDMYKKQYSAYIEIEAEVAKLKEIYDEATGALDDWKNKSYEFADGFKPHWDTILEGTETNYEAFEKLQNKLNEGFDLTGVESEIFDSLRDQFNALDGAVQNADANIHQYDDSLSDLAHNADIYWGLYEETVSMTMGKVADEYTDSTNYMSENPPKLTINDDELYRKFEEEKVAHGKLNDYILRSPAQLKAQNLVTSVANEAQRDWINKNFPAKGLTATNKVGTAVNEAYNTWTGKNFGSKALEATTGKFTGAIDGIVRYWNNTSFNSKGITAYVNLPKGTSVSYYAQGGMVDEGSLFIAGEAGAEMVGNINGRTGVASQGEITGIRQSVEATGNAEARLLAEQNALLRQILAKEGNVTVSTSAIVDGLNRTNRRAGKTVVAMGQ